MTGLTFCAFAFAAGNVDVDVARPENNGVFAICGVGQNLEGTNGEFSDRAFWGHAAHMKVGIRHIVAMPSAEPHKARCSSDDIITVTKPSWECDHPKNRDAC